MGAAHWLGRGGQERLSLSEETTFKEGSEGREGRAFLEKEPGGKLWVRIELATLEQQEDSVTGIHKSQTRKRQTGRPEMLLKIGINVSDVAQGPEFDFWYHPQNEIGA